LFQFILAIDVFRMLNPGLIACTHTRARLMSRPQLALNWTPPGAPSLAMGFLTLQPQNADLSQPQPSIGIGAMMALFGLADA
jgi:hypothetical protein